MVGAVAGREGADAHMPFVGRNIPAEDVAAVGAEVDVATKPSVPAAVEQHTSHDVAVAVVAVVAAEDVEAYANEDA